MKHTAFKTLLPYALRAVVVGGLVASGTFWLFVDKGIYLSRIELCIWLGILVWGGIEWMLYRQAQPRKMEFTFDDAAGYWTHELKEWSANVFDPKITRICIATHLERERVPDPERAFGMQLVGRIHCVVEDKFWVWQETFPWVETESGVFVHPNVR